MNTLSTCVLPKVGVGLRHAHFRDALSMPVSIDFVEVHAENFFADGGVLHQLLKDISDVYPVSLHATAMGLGSAAGIPEFYIRQMQSLNFLINPFLISDHACFAWGKIGDKVIHAGDLLPIPYNRESLNVMEGNVDRVQQMLGRQILVENISAYIQMSGSTFPESEFLVSLCERTGCGLLVDLNNILVNERNAGNNDVVCAAKDWLNNLPKGVVGEFHLAGNSISTTNDLVVDDHSQPVSDECWELYEFALKRFGPVPTLIEWDNQLPDWPQLIDQAGKAKNIAKGVLQNV